ncbi:MAG: putative esterase/lipase [uncultured Nocardioidaceae bacterium]|uniref:Putative esterase/lipase n=1 Tax=uncultured Nocardioidaceae bacterium TaxID=253824 RepID=A0A6J4LI08_9ACTN|nr:MAG: putative esterase/lipase [uncultured Nocardioidaceae bacterium]
MLLDPLAEAVRIDGGDTGVLLSHGFTGSPASMRPFAEHLAQAGHTVRVPRLPGHGTRWQDLNRTGWGHWYAELDRNLTELCRRCSQVAVAGLSMGGCLALRLAQQRPHDVDALVLVNPSVASSDRRLRAVPTARLLVASAPGLGNDIKKPGVIEHGYDRTPLKALHSVMRLWREVGARLGEVRAPLLLFRSQVDHVVDPSSARLVLAGVSSAVREEVVLRDSYHVATLDYDAPAIFERTETFLAEHLNGREPAGSPAITRGQHGR